MKYSLLDLPYLVLCKPGLKLSKDMKMNIYSIKGLQLRHSSFCFS